MWLIIGLIFGALIWFLITLQQNKKFVITWYEWVLGIVGLALLFFTIQNFFGSFQELEPKAAWLFLLVTGLPSVVLLAIPCLLATRRLKSN